MQVSTVDLKQLSKMLQFVVYANIDFYSSVRYVFGKIDILVVYPSIRPCERSSVPNSFRKCMKLIGLHKQCLTSSKRSVDRLLSKELGHLEILII